MTDSKRTSRRSFFLQGGAILGAGVGAGMAAGASALVSENARAAPEQREQGERGEQREQLQRQLDRLADRDAIRQLHLTFTRFMENQDYEAAAELFHERAQLDLGGLCASGKSAILRLFTDQYRQQTARAIHSAYRQNASQIKDTLTLSDDRRRARATFHAEVLISTPLQADCTAAQMARLQGQMADRRWEAGRFDAQYVKTGGRWSISSLAYAVS